VDTWGLDYALLDRTGAPLVEPHHYRHPRSQRGRDAFPLSARELFAIAGTQDIPVNTIYQLFDESRHHPDRVTHSDALLMMADLVNFHLTGHARTELTLARTSGLVDALTGDWSSALCSQLNLPRHLLQPIVRAGETCGELRRTLAEQLELPRVPVIAVASHDTASAVASLALGDGSGFLICGSWSMIGVERPDVDLSEAVRLAGFGYEGGGLGKPYLITSLSGLHLIQKLRSAWRDLSGETIEFAEISLRARDIAASDDRVPSIDPGDPLFFNPDNLVVAIREFFARSGTPAPSGIGALALSIYRGLVGEICLAVSRLEALLGSRLPALKMCGGGTRDALFCEMVAKSVGRPLYVGPTEASAWGNALVQLIGLGAIRSLDEGRRIIEISAQIHDFSRVHPDKPN